MIVLHARLPLDPETRDDALALIEDLAEGSRAEDGIVDYRATTEIGDPNVVHFVEWYEDAAAREPHRESDHYRRFEEALPSIADGELEVRVFEVSGSPEIDRTEF